MSQPIRQRAMLWVESLLARVAAASFKGWRRTLIVAALLLTGAVALSSRLELDADLAALLPKSFASVQDLEHLTERVGGMGYVAIVARNAPPSELKRFAEDAAAKLEALPDIRYVEFKAPFEFIGEHGLYYLSLEDLKEIERRIKRRVDWEVQQRNPLSLDLDEPEPPPPLEFKDIKQKYEKKAGREIKQADSDPYYIDKEKQLLVVLVKPKKPSADLAYAKHVTGRVQQTLAEMSLRTYSPRLEVSLTGTYARKIEQQELITRDLGRASTLALLLMVGFVAAYFRRGFAIVLILLPLCVGIAGTGAVAWLSFGRLNILTGFLGAILLGLGIDHGIHLLNRFNESLKSDAVEAVSTAFSTTGRAAAIAATTTLAGFGALAISEFRAFREFGVLSGAGIVLIFVSYITICPALLGAAMRFGWRPSRTRGLPGRWFPWLLRHYRPLAIVAPIVLLTSVALLPRVPFNYDFRAIQGAELTSFKLDEEVNRLLGRSQSPAVIPTETVEQEREISQLVRQAHEKRGEDSALDFVVSVADLVPPDQLEKQAVLDDISLSIRRARRGDIPPEHEKALNELDRLAQAQPFQREDLPNEIRRQFQKEGSDSHRGVVLAFPALNLHDGRNVRLFAEQLRSTHLDGGRIPIAAESLILADILDLVIHESPVVLGVTFALVLIALLILVSPTTASLICLGAGFTTVTATLALMPLLGLSLNYLNIVVIPVLFGLGVDGAVHLSSRAFGDEDFAIAGEETGRAIAGSVFTTALGFGAMLTASHSGLNSLGSLAVLGLLVNAVFSLTVLPSLLQWVRFRRQLHATRAVQREAATGSPQ